MLGLARRMLTHVVRAFHAFVNRLTGRAARRVRRAEVRESERRVQLMLSPMEARDHTGNLAGGIALAALGYQFTDPLEGMALAVGDLAMLSVFGGTSSGATAAGPTVGDPPQPLTAWLPDEPVTLGLANEATDAGSAVSGVGDDGGLVGVSSGLMDDFWLAPAEAAPNTGSGTNTFALDAIGPAESLGSGSGSGAESFAPAEALGRGSDLGVPGDVSVASSDSDLFSRFGGTDASSLPSTPTVDAPTDSATAPATADRPEGNTSAAQPVTIAPPAPAPALPAPAPVLQAVYQFGEGAGARLLVEGTAPVGVGAGVTIELFAGTQRIGSALTVAAGAGPATFRAVLPASVGVGEGVSARLSAGASDPLTVGAGIGPDGDADGVPDWIETLATAGVAASAATQPGIAALPTATGAFVTLDAGSHALTGVRALTAPSGVASGTFPLGLFDFSVQGVTPGGSATVQLTLPAGHEPTRYLKWDATSGQVTDFAFDGTTGATFDANVITLHFVDGGRGDADGTANGIIVDPGGPGALEVPLVQIVATDPFASEFAQSTGLFRVQRVGPIDAPLIVHFQLAGEAKSDQDPTAVSSDSWDYSLSSSALTFSYDSVTGTVSGTVTIPALARTVGILLTPRDDTTDESNTPYQSASTALESAQLTLVAAPQYWVDESHSEARIGISDDDQPGSSGGSSSGDPVVTVRTVDPTAAENGSATASTAAFEVRRTGSASESLTVYYRVLTKSTATPADESGPDLVPDHDLTRSGSVTIGAGQSKAPIVVTPTADARLEGSESVWIELAPAPGGIEGRVWDDRNGDGYRSDSEPGLAEVTVTLDPGTLDEQTTTSDAEGRYTFEAVAPGDHTLQFDKLTNYVFTKQKAGSDPGRDSDPDKTTGLTASFPMPTETGLSGIDAGMYVAPEVRGQTWIDADGDGLRSATEDPIETTVALYTAADVLVGSQLAVGGQYAFTGLEPGSYYAKFTLPEGHTFTRADVGDEPGDPDADTDSDALDGGKTETFTLVSGDVRDHLDAGLVEGIGDRVWLDADADGYQDANEPGLAGVSVTLTEEGKGPQTKVTDAQGKYHFAAAPSGAYTITITRPDSSYFFSPRGSGTGTDSDADASGVITVPAGEATGRADLDAGLYQKASATGVVWEDANGDGTRQTGEPLLSGVTVELRDAFDYTTIATTTTNSSGVYTFADVTPGLRFVAVTPPSGHRFTEPNAGADTTDSDVDDLGESDEFALGSGQALANVDAGLYRPATIGDFVWADDGDGVQETPEPGVDGVEVTLLKWKSGFGMWVPWDGDTTSGGGAYQFAEVAPGDYKLVFGTAPGRVFAPTKAGGNTALDSNAYPSGMTDEFAVVSGATVSDQDAGLVAGIGDFVWVDDNANGSWDEGESGKDGVSVALQKFNGTIWGTEKTTTTAGGGYYQFTGLADGDYRVSFTAPSGYQFSTPQSGTTGTVTIAGGSGGSNALDAGIYLPATITGLTWHDGDRNGTRAPTTEGPLGGFTITLYDVFSNVVAGPVPTSSSGTYSFPGLVPGDYYLVFEPPSGNAVLTRTGPDSAPDPASGVALVALSSGQTRTQDAGAYWPASIGNLVWTDTNANGQWNVGEAGHEGVRVNLLQGGQLIDYRTTDPAGLYLFGDVAPGSYTLEVPTLPTGYWMSNPASGFHAVTVAAGEAELGADFGLAPLPGSIGDLVWFDRNGNGARDQGEPGAPGIALHLSGPGVSLNTTTQADGSYLFENLLPGLYTVQVTTTGYAFTTPANGQWSGTVGPGQAVTTADLGLRGGSIGDWVWHDTTSNGRQDSGEPGIADVGIQLRVGGWS